MTEVYGLVPHSPRTAEIGLWIPLPLLPFLPVRDKDPSLKKLSLSPKHNPKLVESGTFAFFSVSLAALGGHLESSPSLWGGQDPGHCLPDVPETCCLRGAWTLQAVGPWVKLQVPLLLQGVLAGLPEDGAACGKGARWSWPAPTSLGYTFTSPICK